jgi:hypothetical protein
VLVLPGDPQRHFLTPEHGRRGFGNRQLQLLAAREPVRLRVPLAVDERRALLDQPLGRGA